VGDLVSALGKCSGSLRDKSHFQALSNRSQPPILLIYDNYRTNAVMILAWGHGPVQGAEEALAAEVLGEVLEPEGGLRLGAGAGAL
jgi:hypothetical protein